jgi:glutathione S-transferase
MVPTLPALVSGLALLLYLGSIIAVAAARSRYKIKAPATAGHPVFERLFRVQQNTLEQLLLFLPALWLYCLYRSPLWGAGIGAVWLIGRLLYAAGYARVAEWRAPGFVIGMAASVVLLLGGLAGVIGAALPG